MNIDQIMLENKRRIESLFAPYDPIAGIGGLVEREKLVLDDMGEFYIPRPFFNNQIGESFYNAGSLSAFLESYPNLKNIDTVFSLFQQERFKWDFEYWTATTVKIKPKSGGKNIPFILNAPQRKLHANTYGFIEREEAIRQIVCKSRQWGGSTDIQIEMLWVQLLHKTNWNSLIAAHLNQAATNIRSMVTSVQKYYPKQCGSFTLKGFEGTKNIKIIPERQNKITIGSIETPDSIRSDDVAMAHLSEVGLWKKTDGKSPEDLCQSILGTIPRLPFTRYTLESTAKGVGNFFHRTWQAANSTGEKNNGLSPIFVSWMEDKNNVEYFKSDSAKIEFVRSWTNYEKVLWERGATIEGIHFYRNKLKEFNGDHWRMMSEFPTTADEAFQSTGNRVFPQEHILNARKTCQPPKFVGSVTAASREGKDAFKDISFFENPFGNLSIWLHPENIVEIEGKKYRVSNRYCGFADFGGQSKKSDYSCLRVLDRLWMIEGGLPELAAKWHGKLDADMFALQCAQILWRYDKGLLAFESNTPDQDKEKEGNHFLTAINKLAGLYPNLYIRNNHESIKQEWVPKYGFHTNKATKGMIIDRLKAALRDEEYIERDLCTCDELDYFETKADGTMGAVDGEHDDLVITDAGSVWLALDYMKPVKLIPIEDGVKLRSSKRIISEASI